MMEVFTEAINGSDVFAIVLKVLLTAVVSGLLGLIGSGIGKVIASNKDSRIRKYAQVCVAAAEQKFPNQGKKMGPEKMAYVMDQLAIKFPKIKENTYLYNIAEAAVYELNKQNEQEEAIKEFETKYGEKPLALLELMETEEKEYVSESEALDENEIEVEKVVDAPVVDESKKPVKIKSF